MGSAMSIQKSSKTLSVIQSNEKTESVSQKSNSSRFDRHSNPSARKTVLARIFCLIAVLASSLCHPSLAQAQKKYDPEHPEVKAMIDKALNFLDRSEPEGFREAILFGLAAYKAQLYVTDDPADAKKHPLVQEAIGWVDRIMSDPNLFGRPEYNSTYAPAITLIFLLDIDAEGYKPQIEQLLQFLLDQQQTTGAWGYRNLPNNGDTSQMQYVGLALWLASKETDLNVPVDVGKRALDWMCDVQNPSGGYIYTIPPVARSGAPGIEERLSLAAAGAGTVYVLAEWLQLASQQSIKARQAKQMAELTADLELRLPPSVTEYVPNASEEVIGNARVAFDIAKLRQTMARSNQFFNSRFQPDPRKWTFYYLYAFERYASLRELVDGNVSPSWDDWYDQGVEFCKRTQLSGGNWAAPVNAESSRVSTALAVLFLTRSMQLSLAAKVEGVLRGNKGFGDGNLNEGRGGVITAQKMQRELNQMLETLDGMTDADMLKRYSDMLENTDFSSDTESRTAQLAQLRQFINNKNADLRLAVVKLLGKTRNLDNVPALIFALTDPDPDVRKSANDGLRFISRKVDQMQVTNKNDKTEFNELRRKWEEWYLGIRPNARLLDVPEDDE